MKISDGIHIVGSGQSGFMLTHKSDSHVYLVETPAGNILIDAGVGLDVDRIADTIRADGLDPTDITHVFLTHSHADHAGGAAWFREKFGAKVAVGAPEAEVLRSSDLMDWGLDIAIRDDIYPADYRFPNCEPDFALEGGETFTFGDITFETILTPGHSPGSVCYLMRDRGRTVLFCGDVVVHGGKLMFLNCRGSVMADMRESMPKLANLGVEELYPGHGCFILTDGQEHIDIALENLSHLTPPKNAF